MMVRGSISFTRTKKVFTLLMQQLAYVQVPVQLLLTQVHIDLTGMAGFLAAFGTGIWLCAVCSRQYSQRPVSYIVLQTLTANVSCVDIVRKQSSGSVQLKTRFNRRIRYQTLAEKIQLKMYLFFMGTIHILNSPA